MIEVIFMVVLFLILRGILRQKGRGSRLALLGPALWIAGQAAGGVASMVVLTMVLGPEGFHGLAVYGVAVVCATAGAAAAVAIVRRIPALVRNCPNCGEGIVLNLDKDRGHAVCARCKAKLFLNCGILMRMDKV